jgi:hypothetical protein
MPQSENGDRQDRKSPASLSASLPQRRQRRVNAAEDGPEPGKSLKLPFDQLGWNRDSQVTLVSVIPFVRCFF